MQTLKNYPNLQKFSNTACIPKIRLLFTTTSVQLFLEFQIEKEGQESVCVKEILLELRNYRMGLIQTPDQLKFSYLAIVEGAKQLGLISKDTLTNLVRPPVRPLKPMDSSSSSDDFDDDIDEDDENVPPLPPRRSESLVKSNMYNNGVGNFTDIPDFLQGTSNFEFSVAS